MTAIFGKWVVTNGEHAMWDMQGTPWMMGGMAIVWLLSVVVLVLAIAALIKYLRT